MYVARFKTGAIQIVVLDGSCFSFVHVNKFCSGTSLFLLFRWSVQVVGRTLVD